MPHAQYKLWRALRPLRSGETGSLGPDLQADCRARTAHERLRQLAEQREARLPPRQTGSQAKYRNEDITPLKHALQCHLCARVLNTAMLNRSLLSTAGADSLLLSRCTVKWLHADSLA